MMLNDLDTSVLGEENELGDDSSLEISDNATINGKMDHQHHVSSVLQATAASSDSGLTIVPGTHTSPNPAEFVSMFGGTNMNNCVFQFPQNPVHSIFYDSDY